MRGKDGEARGGFAAFPIEGASLRTAHGDLSALRHPMEMGANIENTGAKNIRNE